jgi:hypothetical protein
MVICFVSWLILFLHVYAFILVYLLYSCPGSWRFCVMFVILKVVCIEVF